ncbi:MAG: ECF transporter S component [Eubacterium sp.]|nr:ECF transporter S component [Eubacterium sp.]MBR1531166.1 ECF transporter S component [Eubacterium sp.]
MNKNLKKITLTGVFSAMIFVLTMFVKVTVPSGYVHFGDAMIYVCAVLLGSPWAMIAGALGEGLADVAGGFAMYAPATVIIKVIIAFLFSLCKNENKLLTVKSGIMTLPAALVTVGGYFAADMIIDKSYAFVDIPGNIIQGVGSAVIFIVIAAMLDKAKIIKKVDL